MMDSYDWAIEELSLSKSIGLGPCSKSTVYRWAREINSRLAHGKYPWRVRADVKTRTLHAIPAPPIAANTTNEVT